MTMSCFHKLCVRVSCFLQVVYDNVMFSSNFVLQCLVFSKLSPTMSCFLQVVYENVLFSSNFV